MNTQLSRRAALTWLSSPWWPQAAGAQTPAPPAGVALPPGTPALQDAGEPAAQRLKGVLNDLHARRGDATPALNIVQIGDSHTAADFFTARLRRRLQVAYGLGATGWLPPMQPPYQGHGVIRHEVRGWALTDSRNAEAPDFPMAGLVARPQQPGATLKVSYLYPPASQDVANQPLTLRLLLKREPGKPDTLRAVTATGTQPISVPGDGKWQWLEARLALPFTLVADTPEQCALGGIWLQERAGGVCVSSVGVNSTVQAQWAKWRPGWVTRDLTPGRPDLVILAYGTNEVQSDWLTLDGLRLSLADGIRTLRRELPSAALLVLTAPDVLAGVGKSGALPACEGRALARMEPVLRAQIEVARAERTLVWNWQAAMGGPCSRMAWEAADQAPKDGVHLQIKGYETAADRLVNDLFAWAGIARVPMPPERG